MATLQHSNPKPLNPWTQRTRGTLQPTNTATLRTLSPWAMQSLAKNCPFLRVRKRRENFGKAGLGSGQFDQTQTTPKAGKVANAVFPAGQIGKMHRIQYPPSVCNISNSNELRRRVTKL